MMRAFPPEIAPKTFLGHRFASPTERQEVPAMPDEQARVEAIRGWFEERGYDLAIAEEGGEFLAAYMLKDASTGAGGTGTGETPLAAAESARRRLQATEHR
jgi:hypothetical protein